MGSSLRFKKSFSRVISARYRTIIRRNGNIIYHRFMFLQALFCIFQVKKRRFAMKTTSGGASRAILGANLRTPTQSWTVVHSFVIALIYPQPCSTIHPPVAFIAVLNAAPLVARRMAHARINRVGGCPLFGQPSSHTTVRAVRHTAVQ